MSEFSKAERRLIRELVEHYRENNAVLKTFLQSLESQIDGSSLLKPYTHTLKVRLKDPAHLKDKLERKIREAKQMHRKFGISKKNLFIKVNDLAGVRILHLHTQQAADIDRGLKQLFEEESYRLVEGPLARTWDDESRALFKSIDIKTKKSPSLYTSVHYVIRPNRKTPYTCEIQVRTLMEEVWGEVNHSINYPHESLSLPCREQIAALARATSTSSRLVDAIFRSHADFQRGADRLSRRRGR